MGTIKGEIKYENNYKLQEDEDKMFKPQVVYEATQQVCEDLNMDLLMTYLTVCRF